MTPHYRTWILIAVVALGACTHQAPEPYSVRYSAALERYPGVALTDTAPIDAFVRFFSDHSGTAAAPTAGALYAPALYFSDTLLTSENHDAVVAHLERMHGSTGDLGVTILDRQVDGADVYLVWRMHARFKPVRQEVVSDSIGITHLRFDESGRIVLQQDFWDATEGFYRHLPIIGPLLRSIGGRFEPDAP